MHQHIGAGEGYVFLLENAAAFRSVSNDHLNFLTGLLVAVGGFAAAIAEYGSAAFVGHAHAHEKGLGPAAGIDWRERKSGLLEHFPDAGLQQVLSRLHQSGGELIDEASDGIAVLPDQHHPILFRTVDAVQDHAVRLIMVGDGFQGFRIRIPGSHIIGGCPAVPVDGFQFIEVQKTVVCSFLDFAHTAHIHPDLSFTAGAATIAFFLPKCNPAVIFRFFPGIICLNPFLKFCWEEIRHGKDVSRSGDG